MYNISKFITEAFRSKDLDAAKKKVKDYFNRYGLGVRYGNYITVTTEAGPIVNYQGLLVYHPTNNNGVFMLWAENEDSHAGEVSGLGLVKNAAQVLNYMIYGGEFGLSVLLSLRGVSLAAALPLVKEMVETNDVTADDLLTFLGPRAMHESTETDIEDLKRRKGNLATRIHGAKKKGKDFSDLRAEYDDLSAKIKALRGLDVSPTASVRGEFPASQIEDIEDEYEERSSPEERFKDMEHYINMVVKGTHPSVLIAGAPGVGKTYRVMRKVKASGQNYVVIKGKETPMAFYQHLWNYRHDNDIIVCDDADDVLTDDTIINLIKAATDSSEERIVTYGTSTPPVMSEEEYMALSPEDQDLCGTRQIPKGEVHLYPKSFEFKGKIIIITNRNAGQVDTAVRNRALICDLSFTVEENLHIIKMIFDDIKVKNVDDAAKTQAMEFLESMASQGKDMEISIRSFITTAKLYSDFGEDGLDEKAVERQVKEQMRWQVVRGGKKY